MLLTPTGGEPASYPLLRHAEWDGWTFSDLIFPAFLVTSGASLAFLLRPPAAARVRLRLLRRVVALVVIGVLYNAFGGPLDLSSARLTGVLQLIGLSGGIAALVVLVSRRRDGTDRLGVIAAVAVGVVGLYGISLHAYAERCPARERCSPLHAVDQRVLGDSHTYGGEAVDYDPEGVLVVLAASSLALVGYVVGQHVRVNGPTASTVLWLLSAGSVLVVLGLGLDVIQPINKRIHTPAFSSFAAGLATLGIALFAWLLDSAGTRWRSRSVEVLRSVSTFPLAVLGRNALVVFLGERILTTMAAQTKVGDGTLQDWILENWVPYDGSAAYIGYGMVLLAVVLVITATMHLLRWRIAL